MRGRTLRGRTLRKEEFVYESTSGFPLKAKMDISLGCTAIKRRFRVEDNGVLHASWQDDKG